MILWLLGTFVIAQGVAGVWFDYVQPRVRFSHLYRQFDLLEEQPPPDVLCLGSSRFGTCLSDAEMAEQLRLGSRGPSVFNLGVPLGDVVASENTLEQVLRQGLRPKLVLLEISPEFVSARNAWLEYHVDRHLRWDHVPRFWRDVWGQGQGGKWLEERLLPWYVHRKGYWNAWGDWATLAWRAWRGGGTLQDARRDWERTLDLDNRSRIEIGQPRTEAVLKTLRSNLEPFRPGGATARSLNRILTRCRRMGIAVVLVAPPLRSDHRQLYTADVEAAFRRYLDQLGEYYHVQFWDGRTALADERFLDNQHADAQGAREFSRRLCSQPILREEVRQAMARD